MPEMIVEFGGLSMLKLLLPLHPTLRIVAFIGGIVLPVAGNAQSSQAYEAPCTTKAECDARADARALRQRQEDWHDLVTRNEEQDVRMRQMRADAHAQTENGRLTRLQEVMRRRREAAAAVAK